MALQSLEITSECILSGKAKVMIAGGFDNISQEGSYEFANMVRLPSFLVSQSSLSNLLVTKQVTLHLRLGAVLSLLRDKSLQNNPSPILDAHTILINFRSIAHKYLNGYHTNTLCCRKKSDTARLKDGERWRMTYKMGAHHEFLVSWEAYQEEGHRGLVNTWQEVTDPLKQVFKVCIQFLPYGSYLMDQRKMQPT